MIEFYFEIGVMKDETDVKIFSVEMILFKFYFIF